MKEAHFSRLGMKGELSSFFREWLATGLKWRNSDLPRSPLPPRTYKEIVK